MRLRGVWGGYPFFIEAPAQWTSLPTIYKTLDEAFAEYERAIGEALLMSVPSDLLLLAWEQELIELGGRDGPTQQDPLVVMAYVLPERRRYHFSSDGTMWRHLETGRRYFDVHVRAKPPAAEPKGNDTDKAAPASPDSSAQPQPTSGQPAAARDPRPGWTAEDEQAADDIIAYVDRLPFGKTLPDYLALVTQSVHGTPKQKVWKEVCSRTKNNRRRGRPRNSVPK
jgi:hypothetical protein